MNNIDKSTKFLLLVIGVTLWMIALNPWLRPVAVAAAPAVSDLFYIEMDVGKIKRDVGNIANGLCLNSKIC